MIEVSGLVKRFGAVVAVDNLSFRVEDGAFFVFLGTNGAGKTTTISCTTTLLPLDQGDITIDGMSVKDRGHEVRSRIGVVFQQSLLDPRLTTLENLRFKADLYGVGHRRIHELVDLVDLEDFVDRPYGVLSGGQKRRVDIARALLNKPRTLFLDEPTTGLDPYSREQVWKAMASLRQELGLTIVLTTHYMQETESVDHVLVIDKGAAVAEGTPAQLRARYSTPRLLMVPAPGRDQEVVAAVERHLGRSDWYREGGGVHTSVPSSAAALTLLNDLADAVTDFQVIQGSMDDVFLNLVNGGRTS
ncbi:ABC transporter ATP-binding protein [Actinomyces wuliandei]|uniref:ABC transporter ATP-binding protein n=1 Tax=Actinomyces wuliandei TaxID=2057743 RepID=UPI00111AD599|nr:ABC transporter ATP-binding protein [Actinomyces wuliandei]